jgi:hypothetical protein
MYTGDYEEKEGQVQGFEGLDTDPNPTDQELEIKTGACADWSLKAGVLAWLLSHSLQAVGFQNHTMARLFATLSRDHQSPQVDIKLLSFVHKRALGTKLQCLFTNFVVRHWGKRSMVDHDDEDAWSVLLKESDSFRKRLLRSTMQGSGYPMTPMTLEHNLIDDEV